MDEVTQQNAALVEQAAAAAESLEEQAQNLAVSVGTFKMDDKGSTAVARRAPAPAAHPAPARKQAPAASKPAPHKAVAKPQGKASEEDGEWAEF